MTTIQIPDARGEPVDYTVKVMPPTIDEWAANVAGPNGTYRVCLQDDGKWRCSCDAFRFSKFPKRECKHTLSDAIRSMAPKITEKAKMPEPQQTPTQAKLTPEQELLVAWIKAKGEVENPPLDGEADAGKYKYKYSKFPSVRKSIDATFAKHGLAILQTVTTSERGPSVSTILAHVNGTVRDCGTLTLPVPRADAQGWGSAITYARRYAMLCVAGIVGEADDDGRLACREPRQEQPRTNGTAQMAPATQPPKPLYKWLMSCEKKAVEEGRCKTGELVKHVLAVCGRDRDTNPVNWPEDARQEVKMAVQIFALQHPAPQGANT